MSQQGTSDHRKPREHRSPVKLAHARSDSPQSAPPHSEPPSVKLFARLIAEWFGTGMAPVAPGTMGSLGALPLFWLLSRQAAWVYWGATALLIVVGTWAAQVRSTELGVEDPSSVVIDEVVGVLLALGLVQSESWPFWALAWLLFRVFDITKPWLIDRAQSLHPEGVGIMADDVLAGIVAGAVALAAARLWG